MTRPYPVDGRAAEDAAAWVVALDDGTGEPVQFAAWLKESATHVEEFLFASAVCAELRLGLRESGYDIGMLIAQARSVQVDNVVSLPVGPAAPPTARSRAASRFPLAAACFALFVVALLAGVPWTRGNPYETAIGEQRVLGLPDGSVVHLNADSRIRVRFSNRARDIRFLEGEALFDVAPDPQRPFRVHAGDTLVQAVGTRFNVHRRSSVDTGKAMGGGETTVSVLEGSVRISRDDVPPAAGRGALAAGEEVRVAADGHMTPPARVDVARMAAWRQRRLIFADECLADIAAEFNRYNHTPQIRVEDDVAARTRMSGVFDADDPGSILLFVAGLPGLSVSREGGTATIRSRDENAPDR